MDENQKLKEAINKSIKELVRMNLALKSRIMDLEKRLSDYNKRGGHRI